MRALAPLALCVLFGCVSDLTVGVEREPDAGVDAAVVEVDAGRDCVPSDCDGLEPPDTDCEGTPSFVCVRAERGCALTLDLCEPPVPTGPCEVGECDAPLLTGPEREPACSDGSAPACERDPWSGICAYQCPVQLACGTADGQGCGEGQYCLMRVGMCGSGGTSGGVCATRPASCDAVSSPVCGCDGVTYGNECEAAQRGANVVFAGACDAIPELCAESECGQAPALPRTPCGDGVHELGTQCVRGTDGACGFQWLSCPARGACNKFGGLEADRCFTDEECDAGQHCEGAVICPCDTECFAPDTPGFCK